MTHLDLLRSIDLAGVRQTGSNLPNELPRLAALGRLLLKKGLARQNRAGKWFATDLGRQALTGNGRGE